MPKQVPIDLELVQMAFEDRDGDGHWFLDTETGEAVRVSDDDDDELREEIEAGFGERYHRIPYQGSDAGYRDLSEFIETVTDDRCRASLEVAIRGSGAFRRFKDVLQTYPAPSGNVGSHFRKSGSTTGSADGLRTRTSSPRRVEVHQVVWKWWATAIAIV